MEPDQVPDICQEGIIPIFLRLVKASLVNNIFRVENLDLITYPPIDAYIAAQELAVAGGFLKLVPGEGHMLTKLGEIGAKCIKLTMYQLAPILFGFVCKVSIPDLVTLATFLDQSAPKSMAFKLCPDTILAEKNDFLVGLATFNAFRDYLSVIGPNCHTNLVQWCIKNEVDYEYMLLISALRDVIFEELLKAGVDALWEPPDWDIAIADNIRRMDFCLTMGLRYLSKNDIYTNMFKIKFSNGKYVSAPVLTAKFADDPAYWNEKNDPTYDMDAIDTPILPNEDYLSLYMKCRALL